MAHQELLEGSRGAEGGADQRWMTARVTDVSLNTCGALQEAAGVLPEF